MAASPKSPKPPYAKTDRERDRERFARAIAKAELGRHYWNARSEQALRRALMRKPKK
jgi:hypothetical protein